MKKILVRPFFIIGALGVLASICTGIYGTCLPGGDGGEYVLISIFGVIYSGGLMSLESLIIKIKTSNKNIVIGELIALLILSIVLYWIV
ncbi:MAG: hypothetical protein ACJAVH_002000 [Bacteroidia bacterium]|jgi:hypothetical protein